MRKLITLFLFIIFLLLSCEVESEKELEVKLDNHPYEYKTPRPLWFKLCYFDGREVKEEIIPPGVKKVRIKVYGVGFRPIIAIPLDELSPLGSYYEVGNKENIYLTLEDGIFSKCLLDASRYEPKIVSRFSASWLKSNGINTQTIDQESFLENLFNGSLNNKNIKKCKIFNLKLSGLPLGYYLSDNPKQENINIRSLNEEIPLSLFPGVYHLWNYERDILFTFVITEEGELHTSLSTLKPLLYQ